MRSVYGSKYLKGLLMFCVKALGAILSGGMVKGKGKLTPIIQNASVPFL